MNEASLQPHQVDAQTKLGWIAAAGFVVAHTQAIDDLKREKTFRDNFSTSCYFHTSVLEMPAEQQVDQPWIEHIRWVAEWLKNEPDIVEGRYGAMRYPIRCLNDLHLFMRNFGYTYPSL